MKQKIYARRWLRQLLNDTRTYWLSGVAVIIASGILGFLFQYQWLGRELVMSEVMVWVTGTLGPAVAMGILFLLWNAVRAPAKLAAADANKLAKEKEVRQDLEAQLEQRQQRREIRESLGGFLTQGRQLRSRCANEQEPPPNAEGDEWAATVETFLRERLGESYIARFQSDAGLPLSATSISSIPHRMLWGRINTRMARLQQFLEELGSE